MDGAIRVSTGIYETPQQAIPREEYRCIGCNGSCFLRSGDIRAKHFAHRKEENTCQHFERMGSNGETAQHKIAKLIIKHILETNRDFSIVRMCHLCNQEELFYIPVKDILEVIVEAEVSNGRADVLIRFKEEEIVIEIMNTHRTRYRKGTWFELTIQEISQKYKPEGPLVMNCNRFYRCSPCEEKVKREEEERYQQHLRDCQRRDQERIQQELEKQRRREEADRRHEEFMKSMEEYERKRKEESERIQREINEKIRCEDIRRVEKQIFNQYLHELQSIHYGDDWEAQIIENEKRERERELKRKEAEERYRQHIEEQKRLLREYEENQIRERERKKQEKIEKELKQKEYEEYYDRIHIEFYAKYITNREPTPPEWEGKESIMYKDCDFLHPHHIIRMLPKQKQNIPVK